MVSTKTPIAPPKPEIQDVVVSRIEIWNLLGIRVLPSLKHGVIIMFGTVQLPKPCTCKALIRQARGLHHKNNFFPGRETRASCNFTVFQV